MKKKKKISIKHLNPLNYQTFTLRQSGLGQSSVFNLKLSVNTAGYKEFDLINVLILQCRSLSY